MKPLAVESQQAAEASIAEACRLLQHRLEYRREVAGRGVYDLQYLRGRGLLLQRLARLINEAGVLDCDYRLRGEVLQQCDLLFGKWPHLFAVGGDVAEQCAVLAQRHHQQSADARLIGRSAD